MLIIERNYVVKAEKRGKWTVPEGKLHGFLELLTFNGVRSFSVELEPSFEEAQVAAFQKAKASR